VANLKIKNYMEDRVVEMLPIVSKNMEICKCERCQMDILAYALNNLPPRYVVTRTGHLYSKLEAMYSQFDADIVTAVTNGAKIIGSNPRHDIDDDAK